MDDPIIDMKAMSRSWPAGPVAESPNERRERIAEALYVMMVGHCAAGNMNWSMNLCAEKAREWADAFVAGASEQPQPTAELLAARAQLHADDQRAWKALGRPEGTHETTNVQRLCAEVERLRDDAAKWHNLLPVYEDAEREVQQLRADLREALALLRDNAEVRMWVFRADADAKAVANWARKRDALLAKHQETPDA